MFLILLEQLLCSCFLPVDFLEIFFHVKALNYVIQVFSFLALVWGQNTAHHGLPYELDSAKYEGNPFFTHFLAIGYQKL